MYGRTVGISTGVVGTGGLAMTGAPIAAFLVMAVAALVLGVLLLRTGRGGRHRTAPTPIAPAPAPRPGRGRHRT